MSDNEPTPSPGVSNLRSRFEQLAQSSGPTLTPSTSFPPSRPTSSLARHGVDSDAHTTSTVPETEQTLRPMGSASSLRSNASGRKPPPPPPPSRNKTAGVALPSPGPSPLLHPTKAQELAEQPQPYSLDALIARKPPPPPNQPVGGKSSEEENHPPVSGITSLRSKFASPVPNLPSTAKPHANGNRIVSQPHPTIDTKNSAKPRPASTILPAQHPPTGGNVNHLPSAQPELPRVEVQDSDPFADIKDATPLTHQNSGSSPPPLPSRSRPNGLTKIQSSELLSQSPEAIADAEVASPEETTTPPSTTRSVPIPPPRPPPRHRATHNFNTGAPASPAVGAPPPLPVRRGPQSPDGPPPPEAAKSDPPALEASAAAPVSGAKLPVRRATAPNHAGGPEAVPASAPSALKHGALPPPPRRMIGPNEKLPPVRPTAAGDQEDDGDDSSDEESGEADKDPKDQLPDASRASRRPPDIHPHAYSTARISVPAHTGMVATSGNRVVMATGHHVKIYDLSRSDLPLFDIDFKDALEWKNKDTKISSIAFRWSSSDRIGCFLWLGLSGGHMAEIDVRIGQVTGMKAAAHSSTVTHLFRYGKSMVSMDDNGKVLIWNPSPEEFGEDLIMAFTQPRVFRIAEKQDWAMIIDGRLWTSARADSAGHYAQAHNAAAGSRGPNIRVYDIFTPGSTGKTVLPIEHVGAVTSGTMLPCTPGRAYLGHEGGCISVWELQTEDGYPRCEEVVKVSVSDVLSLEGVNERLWMGGRKGMITAYEVGPRPWLVKNCWRAHEDLPVLRIETDPWALEALGRLAVVSVGRDEQVRYWDGLLGNDWIETELLKRESQFSVFRPLKVLVVTWNIDAAKPDMLTGNEGNVTFIERVLTSVDRPDIMVFGFQELIDLESRRMAAKTVLYTGTGKKKTNDGGLSDKVTKAYRRWHDWLVMKVKLHMPVEEGYTVVGSESMVGLFSCVFVRSKEQIDLKDVAIDKMKRGMGGYYGNKGGIVTRFVIEDSSVCFVNCHLAAGQHHVRQRNQDVAHLFDDKELLPMSRSTDEPIAYVNGGDGTMVLDHEIVFLNGDMNYRIDQRREIVVNAIKSGDFEWLGVHDQLLKEMKHNRAFRLRHFSEGPLKFAPTYKYDRGSDTYDSSEKKRCPAWCDRVLWRSREPSRVRQLHYQRYEPNVSDHRPVSAAFEMTVKKVDREARAQIKTEVQALWQHEEHRLLAVARNFYIDQRLL